MNASLLPFCLGMMQRIGEAFTRPRLMRSWIDELLILLTLALVGLICLLLYVAGMVVMEKYRKWKGKK